LTLEALKYAQSFRTEFKWPRDVVRDPVVPGYPGYAGLTARPTTTCTPLQKVARSVDKIFNPEADFSGRAIAMVFLQNPDRKRRIWRGFAWPFATDGRPRRGCSSIYRLFAISPSAIAPHPYWTLAADLERI
jgi:hypothetical protein